MANFETIKLDKGLYRTNKSFTQELEAVDPSENYKGTSLEGLDAFERQLKRFDIKINGKDSSTIDKFFATTDSAVLFPEYISRAVTCGMLNNNIVNSIVAANTNINALDYRSISLFPTEQELDLRVVSEGSFIPETHITTSDKLIKLHKRGRSLVCSYEAIRFQRLDVFNIMLKQIGAQIGATLSKDAVNTLINGDGNDNPIPTVKKPISEPINVPDLAELWSDLFPYETTTFITTPHTMATLCVSSTFTMGPTKEPWFSTGKIITPIGAEIVRYEYPDEMVIGLDKNNALEMITAGDITTDFDKIIDRQLEKATITQIAGFAKLANDAAKMYIVKR